MDALQTFLAELELNSALQDPHRLRYRIEALDRIDAWLPGMDSNDTALLLRARAACARLEAINAGLYQDIRDDIRSGRGPARMLQWIRTAGTDARQERSYEGYDHLDELLGGILQFDEPQLPTVELASEMVFYQPTPARHILEMIDRCGLDGDDVLIDLGSGMGHVPLLVAICTSAHAVGVELEPAYFACARQAATALNLGNASFVRCDARTADYSNGTVFYLYTPFQGTILTEVLDRLQQEAKRRPIRVCTFGPCTPVVANEPWLGTPDALATDRLVVFHSRGS
ncbi:hypothetical protein [Lysobacter tyrosinilyticus]